MTFPLFNVGETLRASDMNAVGLWKTAAVTFSGSSGVEVQNCFNSDYANYLVYATLYGSATTNTQTQWMTGTNTKDTAATYNRFGFFYNAGLTGFNAANTTSDFFINHGVTASDYSTAQMTVYRPNVSGVRTLSTMNGFSGDSGLTTFLSYTKATTSQYTGLYLFPTSGTITGTIIVYGLRN